MGYQIEVKDLEDRYVASVRVRAPIDGVGPAYREALPEVDAEILNAGVRPTGPPFAIYHEYGPDGVDMEVGLPIPGPVATSGRVTGRELSATRAAITWHIGPYTTIGEAHTAVAAWIREQGEEPSGPPWEVYWTGPGDEAESAKWRTEVGYPIAG